MTYNSLDIDQSEGIVYFIDDLNTRFTNLLFSDIDGLNCRYSGLARVDLEKGIPHVKDSTGEYTDVLFNDNYDIVTFFMESGDRKFQKALVTEVKLDLYVSVNMKSFTSYEEEGIINEVYNIMSLTSFEPQTLSRDADALKTINYTSKVPDTLYPYFAFKISSKLLVDIN